MRMSRRKTTAALIAAVCVGTYTTRRAQGETITPTAGAYTIYPPANIDTDSSSTLVSAFTACTQGTYAGVTVAGPQPGHTQHVVHIASKSTQMSNTSTYRFKQVNVPSDIRIEIDADVVLEPVIGTIHSSPSIFTLDGPPVTDVTIIGVGSATGTPMKNRANPIEPGWDISNCFTFDLDGMDSLGDPNTPAIRALNIQYFLIRNVYCIQNADQSGGYLTTAPALVLRQTIDSTIAPTRGVVSTQIKHPEFGTVDYWYDIHAPFGFGPNQFGSGYMLNFRNIYSQGGTALRLETDSATGKNPSGQQMYGQLSYLTATNIQCRDGNRAVSFSPHFQDNFAINVTGVRAYGCNQGIIESFGDDVPKNQGKGGHFDSSTVADALVFPGGSAQLGTNTNGGWTLGPSVQAFTRDGYLNQSGNPDDWHVTYNENTAFYGTGTVAFSSTKPSDQVFTLGSGQKALILARTDLLTNGNFEAGKNGWTLWSGNGTIVLPTAPVDSVHSGLQAANIVQRTGGDVLPQQATTAALSGNYSLYGYIRGDTTTLSNQSSIDITWYSGTNGTGSTLGMSSLAPSTTNGSGQYEFVYNKLTAPTGSGSAVVVLHVARATGGSSGTFNFDDLSLRSVP